MASSYVALVVLKESGFIVYDQDKAKATNGTRDWEPIWAWEFHPIVVSSVESLLMSYPTFHEFMPVFHHVRPPVPIKIHTVF